MAPEEWAMIVVGLLCVMDCKWICDFFNSLFTTFTVKFFSDKLVKKEL